MRNNLLALTFSLVVVVGALAASPAVAVEADARPCVTRGEYRQAKQGMTKIRGVSTRWVAVVAGAGVGLVFTLTAPQQFARPGTGGRRLLVVALLHRPAARGRRRRGGHRRRAPSSVMPADARAKEDPCSRPITRLFPERPGHDKQEQRNDG